jgi:hypothetical protein
MLKDIYFFNAKELARKLAQNEISEKLALWHFMVQAIVLGTAITFTLSIECGEQENYSTLIALLGFATSGFITYWGLSSLFKVNSNIDGENFFIRYAALSLPSGMQVFIVMLVLAAVFGVVAGTTTSISDNEIPVLAWLIAAELLHCLMVFLFFKIMLGSYQEILDQKKIDAN